MIYVHTCVRIIPIEGDEKAAFERADLSVSVCTEIEKFSFLLF